MLGLNCVSIRLSLSLLVWQGLVLWKMDLFKTIRRARTGIVALLLPMVLAALLTLSFAQFQASDRHKMAALVVMNIWLIGVDYGTYPLRLVKRLRPLFLAYTVSGPALFVASSLNALLGLVIRSVALVMLLPRAFWEAGLSWPLLLLPVGLIVLLCFSLGIFLASISRSFHEIFLYAPHIFIGLGAISGFFELPSILSPILLLKLNPLVRLADRCRDLVLSSHAVVWPDFTDVSIGLLIAGCSALLLMVSRRLFVAITLI